ncbi:MAG: heme-binding domain-containing protein [marine benthic group bacterium]|nr:heme-binding domain-containing protein [Gemmatimonadota bacterium]
MNGNLARYSGIGLAILFVLIQFVPVDRSNPTVTGVVDAPEEVMLTLRRSCWDCHSNETEWPRYARVAPLSWRLSQHVSRGREHLNFTEWDGYDVADLDEAYEEIGKEMESEGMPLGDYLLIHREAVLSRTDRQRLIAWAEAARESLPERPLEDELPAEAVRP